ncbi:hypothetical protein ACWCYZ_38135 [Streptomyces virginiae]
MTDEVGQDLVLDAARALRGDLEQVVGSPEPHSDAVELDRRLAALLAVANTGSDVKEELHDLLLSDTKTRGWYLGFLSHGMPPDLVLTRESGPPGSGEPVSVPKFCCPGGDMTWYRRSVGQNAPRCSIHDLALDPC